jgi:AraC-like DNA-binding protein
MADSHPRGAEGTLLRWQSASIPGFEICYCHDVPFDASQRFVFDTYTVTLVEAGQGSFDRNGHRREDIVPGSIAVSMPGDVIAAHSLGQGFTCRNVYLTPALVEEAAGDGEVPALFQQVTNEGSANVELFRQLELATRTLEQSPSALERDTRLWLGLRRLARVGRPLERPRYRGERPAIRRARELLLDRLHENVTLEELADAAHLNRFHLLRVFARETGLPPHRYQQHARIGRARALLAAGSTALEAAVEVGFADQAHFTRVFKRQLGVTPGAYRAMYDGRKLKCPTRARGGHLKPQLLGYPRSHLPK